MTWTCSTSVDNGVEYAGDAVAVRRQRRIDKAIEMLTG